MTPRQEPRSASAPTRHGPCGGPSTCERGARSRAEDGRRGLPVEPRTTRGAVEDLWLFSGQLVRLHTVDVLGWKRGSFMPRVPRLSAGASLLLFPRYPERRRLDDVRRRRLRACARVTCQACDLCRQRRDLRHHGGPFRCQIRERFSQERILALQLLNRNVLVVHGARYTTRSCGSLDVSRNSGKTVNGYQFRGRASGRQ